MYSLLEDAIVCGMTPQQFWSGGMDDVIAYMYAHNRLQREKAKEMDAMAWTIGAYVKQVLESQPIMPYGMMVSKDIRRVAKDYPLKPLIVLQKEKEEEDRRAKEERILADKPDKNQLSEYHKLMAGINNKRTEEQG